MFSYRKFWFYEITGNYSLIMHHSKVLNAMDISIHVGVEKAVYVVLKL